MKNIFVVLLFICKYSLFSQKLVYEEILNDTTYSSIQIIDTSNLQHDILLKNSKVTCLDIRNIIQKCCEISLEDVEKTCAGRYPHYVLFLKNTDILIKLFTFENYVFDYLNMNTEDYIALYQDAQVYRIEIFKNREYVSSILKIKYLKTETCVLDGIQN
jgi:5'(3')-deoxyribonucleotidase